MHERKVVKLKVIRQIWLAIKQHAVKVHVGRIWYSPRVKLCVDLLNCTPEAISRSTSDLILNNFVFLIQCDKLCKKRKLFDLQSGKLLFKSFSKQFGLMR